MRKNRHFLERWQREPWWGRALLVGALGLIAVAVRLLVLIGVWAALF